MLELDGRIAIRVGVGRVRRRQGKARLLRGAPTTGETSPFDVMRVRRLVESEAAALAARHATPAQIAALVAAFNRLAAQMRANRIRPAADREFHLCIAHASGNTALAQVIERLLAAKASSRSTRAWRRSSSPADAGATTSASTGDPRRDPPRRCAGGTPRHARASRQRGAAAARAAARKQARTLVRARWSVAVSRCRLVRLGLGRLPRSPQQRDAEARRDDRRARTPRSSRPRSRSRWAWPALR